MQAVSESDDWVALLRDSGETQAQALARLRKILLGGLRRSFSSKGVDDAFLEDMVQESIVRVLDKLDQFEGRSKFTTWAMSIAIRQVISELRKKRFQNVSLGDITQGERLQIEIVDNDAADPELARQRQTVLAELKELIETRISDKQRIALQALLGGMPVEEIAERTESNRNAVYKLIHDARQKLKSELQRRGHDANSILNLFA